MYILLSMITFNSAVLLRQTMGRKVNLIKPSLVLAWKRRLVALLHRKRTFLDPFALAGLQGSTFFITHDPSSVRAYLQTFISTQNITDLAIAIFLFLWILQELVLNRASSDKNPCSRAILCRPQTWVVVTWTYSRNRQYGEIHIIGDIHQWTYIRRDIYMEGT